MSPAAPTTPNPPIGFDATYLPQFEAKLFVEGPATARRLTNFFVLLLSATVIATFGLLSDSAATVIGAMIVAPLMEPIMATAAAIVMGSLVRAIRAFALATVGALAVVATSYVLAAVVPDVAISFTSNSELSARIHPGLYALLTALGAGTAGAFIVSRAEIADAMGGVAIAISLVPPLAVVGIALQQGLTSEAAGASLLFLTNLLAILLAGGIVLRVSGVGRVVDTDGEALVRRRAMVVVTAGLLVVVVPLAAASYDAVSDARDAGIATAEVRSWLDGSDYSIVTVAVTDGLVAATVEGEGSLPPIDSLAANLGRGLGRPVVVNMTARPAQLLRAFSP